MTNGVFFIPLQPGADDPSAAPSAWPLPWFVGDAENVLVPVVAEEILTPVAARNPVVLCGPTGVGKSHLALGLLHRWREAHPTFKAVALTGADFARNYARAVQTDTTPELRARLLQARLLLLDGLEELLKKPAAQQELIHTLDAALAEGVRVVVVTRESLAAGGAFLPGLASRLAGGLVVPMAAPGLAARRALARSIAASLQLDLDDEALDALAEETTGTANELRHAMVQVREAQESHHRPVALDAVRQVLDRQNEQRRPTVNKIASQVARRFRLKAADLQGTTRRREVVQARGVAMLLARKLTGASYKTVGRHFGGRDHSTVLHACRRIAQQLQSDPVLQRAVEELASPWA